MYSFLALCKFPHCGIKKVPPLLLFFLSPNTEGRVGLQGWALVEGVGVGGSGPAV